MRSDELVAAALLAELLERDAMPHDRPGEGELRHDWDLRTGAGGIIAVEVTMHVDRANVEFWHKGPHNQEVPGLGGTFIVQVDPSANRNDLWRRLPTLLPRLPPNLIGADLENVRWYRPDPTPTPEEELLESLGVRHVGVVPGVTRSAIMLTTSGGGALGPEVVVDAAMGELEKNRAKLAAAVDAVARHLFVWIDGSAALASMSLRGSEPPSSAAPHFGSGVDVLWVAAVDVTRRPLMASVLWRAESGGPWADWTPRLKRS